MGKVTKTVEAGVVPPSPVPYKEFRCPNKDCDRVEKGGHAPFYSSCPSCFKPAGAFLPVEAKPAKAGKKGK